MGTDAPGDSQLGVDQVLLQDLDLEALVDQIPGTGLADIVVQIGSGNSLLDGHLDKGVVLVEDVIFAARKLDLDGNEVSDLENLLATGRDDLEDIGSGRWGRTSKDRGEGAEGAEGDQDDGDQGSGVHCFVKSESNRLV